MEEFFEMTDEQFAELGKQHQAEVAKQPRDESGRFVSPSEPAEVVEPPAEVDEVVYRREIDLGDGSGKQVFEADSMDGLVDKLATAQEHASRKIRELAAEKRAAETPVEPAVSADEDWLISQELMSTPSKGFQKLFEQQVGLKITDFKTKLERITAFERAQSEIAAANAFTAAHPEYIIDPHNGGLMENYLKTFRLEGTPDNIERAFTELSQGGLLKLNTGGDATATPGNTDTEPTKQRIAAPAGVRTTVIQKRAASGLSAKGSAVSSGPPSTEDLYTMPEEEFFKLGGMSKQDVW